MKINCLVGNILCSKICNDIHDIYFYKQTECLICLQYQEDLDLGFPGGLVCALCLLLLIGGVQAVVLPRTKILLLLFLTAFIWVAVILILLLAVRYVP